MSDTPLLELLTERSPRKSFFRVGRWYIAKPVLGHTALYAWNMLRVRVLDDGERQICLQGFGMDGEGWLPDNADTSLWRELSDVEVTDMFLSKEMPAWQSTDHTQ